MAVIRRFIVPVKDVLNIYIPLFVIICIIDIFPTSCQKIETQLFSMLIRYLTIEAYIKFNAYVNCANGFRCIDSTGSKATS